MALNIVNNPTPVSNQTPTTVGKWDYGNLYHQPFIREYWESGIVECYGKYDMLFFLEKLGNTGECRDNKITWAEISLKRRQLEIASAVIGTPTSQATITLVGTEQYYVPSDEIMLPSGVNVRVISTTASPNTITVESVKNIPLTLADMPTGGTLFLVGNFQAPCYTLPTGRHHFPKERTAITTTIAENYPYCEDEVSQPMWMKDDEGNKYWYYTDQKINRKHHWRNVEGRVVFGQGTTTAMTDGATASPGIIDQVMIGGTVDTYTGVLSEDDFIDYATQLAINSELDNEYFVPCGSVFLSNVTKALKDYRTQCCEGKLSREAGEFAFNVTQFKINGIIFNFKACETFNEREPSPTTGHIDYRNFALFLNVGEGSGFKGVELLYHRNFKDILHKGYITYRDGHYPKNASGSHQRSSNENCFEEAMSTKYLLKMNCLHNHGILYKV